MKKIPRALMKIIQHVTDERTLTSDSVSDLLKNSVIKMNDLIDYIRFDHPDYESYGRNMIWDSGFFKLMLMTWNPGDFTAAHDHGYVEWGAVKCFGNFSHIIYEMEDETLKIKDDSIMPDGIVAKVQPDLIHQMGNNSDEHIFSLHLYGSDSLESNISRDSKIFDLTNNKIEVTDGQAFLQLPDSLIKRTIQGLKTDHESVKKDRHIKIQHFTTNKMEVNHI